MINTDSPDGTRPVILSVRGEQFYDGVDPDTTELMTEGTLSVTKEGFLLSYEESTLTGMEHPSLSADRAAFPGPYRPFSHSIPQFVKRHT